MQIYFTRIYFTRSLFGEKECYVAISIYLIEFIMAMCY